MSELLDVLRAEVAAAERWRDEAVVRAEAADARLDRLVALLNEARSRGPSPEIRERILEAVQPPGPPRVPDRDPVGPIGWTPSQERARLSIHQVLKDGPRTPAELAAAIVRDRDTVVQIVNYEIRAGRIREVTGREAATYPDAVELA